jgi:hypothetical protein
MESHTGAGAERRSIVEEGNVSAKNGRRRPAWVTHDPTPAFDVLALHASERERDSSPGLGRRDGGPMGLNAAHARVPSRWENPNSRVGGKRSAPHCAGDHCTGSLYCKCAIDRHPKDVRAVARWNAGRCLTKRGAKIGDALSCRRGDGNNRRLA